MSGAIPNTPGPATIPCAWLEALANNVRLTGREARVIHAVLASPAPPTARRLSVRFGWTYTTTKAVIRGLLRWGVLCRTEKSGLLFEPNVKRWGPPGEVLERPRETRPGRTLA